MVAVLAPRPSSSGLTGRSSPPRAIHSISYACVYWMPAFAGMTESNNERRP